MKLWLVSAMALILFTGCNSRQESLQLQKKQALLIQQQQAQIEALNAKLNEQAKAKKIAQAKRQSALSVAPKKNIKLKKVEDNNYTSGYMYPGETKRKPVKVAQAETKSPSAIMNKSECIAMIGEDKFTKYTEMFGSEAASLKRCTMLKVMKQ